MLQCRLLDMSYNSVILFAAIIFPFWEVMMLGEEPGRWAGTAYCYGKGSPNARINGLLSVPICLTPLLYYYFLLETIFCFVFADTTFL